MDGISLVGGRGRARTYPKPKTDDPFINCSLVSLGRGRDGFERFTISSLNMDTGARTLVLDENGGCRVYTWRGPMRPLFCYGAVAAGRDTVWLGGGAASGPCLYRLELSSGERRHYPAPAGHFITSGMAYDPVTRKVFTGCGSAMVSFDTARGRYVRAYTQDEMGPSHFHYFHWRNRDGSYGFLLQTPGLTYVRWFPREERIAVRVLITDPRHPALPRLTHGLVSGGRVYLPHLGWLDGLTGRIARHPSPPREEASWFGAIGPFALGAQPQPTGDCRLLRWDTRTGEVRALATLPDQQGQGIALTRSGRVLAVDLTGTVRRFDARTLELERTVVHEHRSAHAGHVICPAGRHGIVGAPFITQGFWILDARTGRGLDAGRAAGSFGQIDDALFVNGKVYFSAYGGGQLTEFDPRRPPNWPRNPRLVAKNEQGQHGAGMTTDGRVVWVAYRPRYGTLDGAMIRYDTRTGEAGYRNAAIRNQHVLYPMWDPATRRLVAGTSFLSDAGTAVPTRDRVYAVLLDPVGMEVIGKAPAPRGLNALATVGPLRGRRWLMRGSDGGVVVFDEASCTFAANDGMQPLPEEARSLLSAGTPGLFLLVTRRALRLWDYDRDAFRDLATFRAGLLHRCWVHGRSVYCDCVRTVAVLENVLP